MKVIISIYMHQGFKKLEEMRNVIQITTEELQEFYREYKAILPESITQFENLFNIGFSDKN